MYLQILGLLIPVDHVKGSQAKARTAFEYLAILVQGLQVFRVWQVALVLSRKSWRTRPVLGH